MVNYEEFTERYYPTSNESRKGDIERFIKNLNTLIGETPIKDALRDKKILCRAFYLQKAGNNISRPHYQKIKEYLTNVLDLYGISSTIPTRDEVIASQETITYFRSIDKLLDFIDSVGESLLESYNPTRDLVRLKCVCILGWLGFTPEEISDMTISDLQPIDLIGYKLTNKNGIFEVYGNPFSALFYLTELESYKGIPSGRTITLKGDNDYLFRSSSEDCEKLDGGQIIQIIKRFNVCIPFYINTSIAFRNLRKNALFIDIYNDKSDKPLMEKITSIMKCTFNYGLNYKAQYLKFVELLEQNKI